MKKRFFNALLLGAVLLSTGAVTSCKDYDDDINNLQGQIDKLSQLETLKTDVATLNTAVAAAKTAADDALKAAQAAQSTADKKADAATVTALENAVKEAKAAADKAAADLATAKTELTELINSKASAEDLKKANEKIAAAEQAIEAAKKAATDADAALKQEMTQAIADATKDLVTKAALDTEVKALDAKINTLVGDKVADQMKALQEELKKLQGIADKLKIAYSTMITDIQLYGSPSYGFNGSYPENFDSKLNFVQATEVDSKWRVYGSETAGWDFAKGNYYLGGDSVLVRVSPANAVLNKEAISLLNSQGKDANDVVEVESVYKYDRLMTMTRANASETGLWVVKFRAKDVEDAFAAAAIDKSQGYERSVAYAVAVDNDVENVADTRRVTSEYALSLHTSVAAHGYDFMVNSGETTRCIQNIHNRYTVCDDNIHYTTKVPELVWMDQHKPYALEEVKTEGADRNAVNRPKDPRADDRQWRPILSVEKGKAINIDFNCDFHYNISADIKGFYVTLDEAFALESTPSEINAWKSYEYVGVGYTKTDGTVVPATLFEGNKGTIVIKDMNNVVGDVIGFRVHAVNYDGTVTDPDGRAFYVAVGDVKTDVAINEGKAVEVKYTEFNGELKFVSDFIATDAYDVDFNDAGNQWENNTKDLSGIDPEFTVKYYDENKVEINDLAKVKFVRFVLDNPEKFIDGGTYTQQMTLFNNAASGAISVPVRTVTATITKVMPAGPEFGYLTNMDKNQWPIPAGNNYVIANQPKGAHIDLNNFLISMNNKYTAGKQSLMTENGSYQFNIAKGTYLRNNATSKWYNGDAFVEANGVFGNQIYILDITNWPSEDVDKANLIDNTTSHAITAEYNFAGISKRPKTADDVKGITEDVVWDNNYVEGVDYVAAVASTAEVVYHTWLDNGTLNGGNTWTGAYNNTKDKTKYYVEWNSDPTGDNWQFDLSKAEIKINDRVVPAVKPTCKNLAEAIQQRYLKVLNSDIPNMPFKAYTKNGNQINPYYEVTGFSENLITIQQNNQITQVPVLPIDNTVLVFKVQDCFGNIFDVELPFGIKRGSK